MPNKFVGMLVSTLPVYKRDKNGRRCHKKKKLFQYMKTAS